MPAEEGPSPVWLIDGVLNFIPYAGAPLGVLMLAPLLRRRRRLWLLAGAPFVLWAAYLGMTSLLLSLERACPEGPTLRVATANVLMSNRELPALADRILAEAPDVVVFEELQQDFESFSPALAAAYPYRVSTETPWVTLASRLPLEEPRRLTLPHPVDGREPLAARVRFDGRSVTVLAVHAVVPLSAETFAVHRAQYDLLAREIGKASDPVIAIGDFNSTVFSPGFDRFLLSTGLRIASTGRLLRPTHFPRWNLSVRIDHVLVRNGFDVCGEQVFDLPGSDHRAVTADLRPN